MQHPHFTLFDIHELTVLEVWRAAQFCGFALFWNPVRRVVELRPMDARP